MSRSAHSALAPKSCSLLVVWVLLIGTPGVSLADPDHWVIDEDHFSVAFMVSHAGFAQQFGMFLDAEGAFYYDEQADELHSGEVTIRSDSVFTDHEERDGHVRNEDFLHVDAYPEMHFRATEYDAEGGVLRGEFTLLGTTREIELDVSINRIDESPFDSGGLFSDPPRVLGASLRGTIHRSEYGMTYALEDELVGDEVQIMLEFEAHRQD